MPDRVTVTNDKGEPIKPRLPVYGHRWSHIALPWPGRPLDLLLTGDAVVGIWLHYLRPDIAPPRGRTVPCCKPEDHCDHCRCPQRPARWSGYCAAWHVRLNCACLACFSENAVYSLPDLMPADGASLRGWRVKLSRDGRHANSPVIAERVPWTVDLEKLPQPVDVRDALLHLWGYSSCTGLAWDDLRGLEVAEAARDAKAKRQ